MNAHEARQLLEELAVAIEESADKNHRNWQRLSLRLKELRTASAAWTFGCMVYAASSIGEVVLGRSETTLTLQVFGVAVLFGTLVGTVVLEMRVKRDRRS